MTLLKPLVLSWSLWFLSLNKAVGLTVPKTFPHLPSASLHSGSEYLDSAERYLLSWSVNDTEKIINFQVTAETTGYVGFGVSPNGAMTGADILIAGVYSNGTVYSSDRHGVGNTEPVEDAVSNWVVTRAEETETHTTLHFHRLLNTCDKDDLEITVNTMRLIWSLGATDDIRYHGNANRGTKSINFYLPNEDDFDPGQYEKLDLVVDMVMPSEHTAYWCTIHQAPLFTEKHHIVAFEPVLENAAALQHSHHFILWRCTAPADQDPDAFFGSWVNHPGDYCHGPKNSSFPFLQNCMRLPIYVWSKGGKRLVFPAEMGLPVPEQLGRREYYALDLHYDNPGQLEGVKFRTGARIYYTSNVREMEIGFLRINQEVLPQLTIPPQTVDYLVAGHCSGACTEKYLPVEGVTIFNNLFHAHLAGRKMKLRHFRGDVELAWVDVDEYYDFDFQQNKPLSSFRKLERGDQLTVECTMNSMGAEGGRAVVGGLGTREEMCEAILYYYPREDLTFCGSYQDVEGHMNLLGMTEYREKTSEIAGELEYEILEPPYLAGDYLTSVSFQVNWTTEFRERFQQVKRYGEQIGICFSGNDAHFGPVSYPEHFQEFVPPDTCED